MLFTVKRRAFPLICLVSFAMGMLFNAMLLVFSVVRFGILYNVHDVLCIVVYGDVIRNAYFVVYNLILFSVVC